jgi:signal transduction histidine kinase
MPRVLAAPFAMRTWRETAYLLVGLLLAVPGAVLVMVAAVAVPLSVLTVGLPMLVAALTAVRVWSGSHRWASRALLGRSWTPPPALHASGLMGRVRARLADRWAWRAMGYCAVKLPLAMVGGYALALLLLGGLIALSCPIWWWVTPTGLGQLDVGDWGSSWLVAAPGLAAVLLFPWVVRLLVVADTALIGALLAADDRDRRITQLEDARSQLTDDASTTLRRVERDLHDGTQAHLVALGMTLARIRTRTGGLPDGGEVDQLLESAQSTVRTALAEVRDLVRGIHPPALDDGLETALRTLVSRSAVPVDLDVELTAQPSDVVATAAYFSVAELLTNVSRHSGATRARVTVSDSLGQLRLTVRDDGRGGASADGAGSGLPGLFRRVAALDGTLSVASPIGGPTTVTVTLPVGAGGSL